MCSSADPQDQTLRTRLSGPDRQDQARSGGTVQDVWTLADLYEGGSWSLPASCLLQGLFETGAAPGSVPITFCDLIRNVHEAYIAIINVHNA